MISTAIMKCILPCVSLMKKTDINYILACKIKVKFIPQQAEVAQGVPGRLKPRIFLTFRHYKGSSLSAKHTGRLYPRRNPWYSLSEADSTPDT